MPRTDRPNAVEALRAQLAACEAQLARLQAAPPASAATPTWSPIHVGSQPQPWAGPECILAGLAVEPPRGLRGRALAEWLEARYCTVCHTRRVTDEYHRGASIFTAPVAHFPLYPTTEPFTLPEPLRLRPGDGLEVICRDPPGPPWAMWVQLEPVNGQNLVLRTPGPAAAGPDPVADAVAADPTPDHPARQPRRPRGPRTVKAGVR